MPQSPLLARFANEKARVTADQLDAAFNTIERYPIRYASEGITDALGDCSVTLDKCTVIAADAAQEIG